MSKIISIHSFRGGTGKSNTTANLAALLAADGKRVGIVDTDIQSPGIHILFGLEPDEITHSLNDFLADKCTIKQAAYDVSSNINKNGKTKTTLPDQSLYLIPSSLNVGEITRIIREGYDTALLTEGLYQFVDELQLDLLLIDTHPGLNEETLLSVAISNVLVIILRPDQQDYQGTAVTVEVARMLDVERIMLVVNKAPQAFKPELLKKRVEKTYNCPVAAIIPHSDELMALASAGIFSLRFPNHPVTDIYKKITATLME